MLEDRNEQMARVIEAHQSQEERDASHARQYTDDLARRDEAAKAKERKEIAYYRDALRESEATVTALHNEVLSMRSERIRLAQGAPQSDRVNSEPALKLIHSHNRSKGFGVMSRVINVMAEERVSDLKREGVCRWRQRLIRVETQRERLAEAASEIKEESALWHIRVELGVRCSDKEAQSTAMRRARYFTRELARRVLRVWGASAERTWHVKWSPDVTARVGPSNGPDEDMTDIPPTGLDNKGGLPYRAKEGTQREGHDRPRSTAQKGAPGVSRDTKQGTEKHNGTNTSGTPVKTKRRNDAAWFDSGLAAGWFNYS